ARDELPALASLHEGDPRGYGDARDAELAETMAGSGIVYVQTTRAARETAAWLAGRGIAADYYHGGRRAADRERVQEAFMEGRLRVVAATNAFGLGIDKPDVRFVIHRQPPASVEEYHQEAGRAGRDGLLARCVLIHRPGALGRAAFLAGGGRLEREEVRRAREGLLRRREGTLAELGEAAGLGRADLIRLVDLLVQESVAERSGSRVRLTVADFDPDAIPLEGEERRRAYGRSRLQLLRALAETGACRRRFILNYLGEDPPWDRCGTCDNDALGVEPTPIPDLGGTLEGDGGAGLEVGDAVEHERFGPGVVQSAGDGRVTVAFEDGSIRTLAAALAAREGVLRRI
ncbi:MAG: ATP-dependent helicase RecQ, partial [Miltoncostaeaceae bacterium]|nr:ATP-dependent helicase RecQ [Miltoncostaeaceae bacterium]